MIKSYLKLDLAKIDKNIIENKKRS